MRILITGGQGFLARHLLKTLGAEHEIRTTSRHDDVVQILNEFKPEFVFHFGAELKDVDVMFESNVIQTWRILEWVRNNLDVCQKVVVCGTSSEYGRLDSPMSETDCPLPDTIYAGTKAATSMIARSWSKTWNIPLTYIRPFTIYGPDEKPTKLTQILFRKWKDGSVLELSEGVHDYVYVDDFIEALITISFWKEKTNFNLINIGSGLQYSNSDFVRAFQKETRYTFPVHLIDAARSYDSSNWVADSTLLETKYSIKFPPLHMGIKRLVADWLHGKNS